MYIKVDKNSCRTAITSMKQKLIALGNSEQTAGKKAT
jgi:hypothetical protein